MIYKTVLFNLRHCLFFFSRRILCFVSGLRLLHIKMKGVIEMADDRHIIWTSDVDYEDWKDDLEAE